MDTQAGPPTSVNSRPGEYEQGPANKWSAMVLHSHMQDEHGWEKGRGPSSWLQTAHANHHLEEGHLLDHMHPDMPEKLPKYQPTIGGIFNDRRSARYV